MSSSTLRIALLQMPMAESATENYQRAEKLTAKAKAQGADIVCLPELFTTPYFCRERLDAAKYAEEIPGPTSEFLSTLARTHELPVVGGSFYERDGESFFNTSLIVEKDGTILGKYRKIHIPQDECFYEKEYFAEGDLGYLVCDTSVGKIGVLICYDQWFPEAARSLAMKGAEVIFYPTAIANVKSIEQTEGEWQSAWENVQRGHAIANGVVVAAANRVGDEGDSTFWGGSFVIDAFGKTLVRGDASEAVLIQEVDLNHGKEVKDGWGFLRNRRPDTYASLLK